MLALTFSTGIGDAVGYLSLDRVFTGNMTGSHLDDHRKWPRTWVS
jgi:uncharacterized membrane protein YoaK (UPF0700 family)